MKIKVSEATDQVLDWLVAKAEGHEVAVSEGSFLVSIRRRNVVGYFDPSGNWGWGGPIIDREDISLNGLVASLPRRKDCEKRGGSCNCDYYPCRVDGNFAPLPKGAAACEATGTTKLQAAMRCFVMSRLGDEVDVPDELMS